MARISTYNLDDGISVNDLLLGSSYEGTNNGNPVYATRNYRLSDLAQFFESYDFTNNISLVELDTRLSVVEGYGNHATAGYLTTHPNITAASSVDNSGQFFIQDITLDSNGHILSITSAEAAGGGSSTDLTSFQVLTSAAGTASLTYDNTTGDFTYTPPDLSSYLTSVAFADLTAKPTTIAGYGITDAFDGAYSSLTGAPDVYTETEIDGFFAGTSAITGYSKTNWDSAYSNSITSMTVTGTSTKTITLNQQDGSTVTATFTDISETGSGGITDTNDYVTGGSFTNGTLTLQVQNQSNVNITGFDSRYYTETEVDNLIANYITLASISTSNSATPSGNGAISYNSGTGVITYTPPDFSGSYLPTSGGTIDGDLTVTGIINVNSATGTSNFINDVSIDGDLSVDGAFTIGTVTGDIRGDVYSIVGSTSSVKVLESGSGNTPDTYYIGDLRNSDTDQVFDTSLAMFRKNLKIGDVANDLGGGAENLSLTLGASSFLYFADGVGPTHPTDPYTYINATKVSNWDFSVLTSSKFQMGQTTGTPQEDLIQFNINGSAGLTSAYSIKPGTYLSASTDTDTHVLLDVNTGELDDRYVDIDGDTMTGNLSFDAENKGVVGNILNTNGTKILENGSNTQTAYLVGNVAGDIIQSDLSTVIFDSSEDAFTRGINIGVPGTNNIITDNFDIDLGVTSEIYFGRGITSGADQEQYVSGAKISQWDAANEKHITNMEFQEGGTGNEGKFELYITAQDSGQNRTTDFLIEEGSNITMSVTERVTNSGQGAINISAKLATATTDGLITKSQLSNFGVSSLTASGTVLNGAIEIIGSNGISVSGDGTDLQLSIAADNATTSTVGVVQLATVAQAEDLANNNTSDNVVTLETLDAALGEEITIPTLQQVTTSGDETNHDIHIVGSQQEMLLTRVNSTSGNNNIATFDTFSSQGYIQVGSQISSAQDYGYIGHSSSGLHLSKLSGTGSGIVINSSDNVSMGGNLSVSGTLTTTGVSSLDGGISVDGAFTVADTSGNVSTTGTLASGNTSITGTLTVSTTSDLQGAVTANSLTVTNNSTLNTVSLGGHLTPSVDSTHDLGTDALRFANVYTDNLNGVAPGNFANKTQATTFYDGSAYKNVTAADFILASDINLKENIIPLSDRKIDVDFKEYNFKGSKRTRFGVIAQDIEEKHPEFVHTREGGDKTVSYIDLLIAKVHELENRIKKLENASTR